jgi:hypothetical protein
MGIFALAFVWLTFSLAGFFAMARHAVKLAQTA